MRRNIITFFLLLILASSAAYGRDVSLSLSQKSVGLNDSFTAIFSTAQKIQGEPDFSPLEAEFDILSSGQEYSTTIVNGAFSQERSWRLVLVPKREGELIIPSIQFGPYSSPEQPLLVTEASTPKHDEALFLEATLSPSSSAYVQSALIYTIRLYTSLKISQGSLSEPKSSDPQAIIEPLGDNKEFEHYGQNGRRYLVIEKKYTIIPQQAGELVISPTLFEGQIIVGRHAFFDMQTQFKRISSNACTVEIAPIPSPFQQSNWLPARNLTLTEEWSGDPASMTVGEPITWTLTIAADDCFGDQIPTPSLNLPVQLKHYQDKPEVNTEETAKGIKGTKQIKIALIGTSSGDVILPEVTLKWWDLGSNRAREATLPEKTLRIDGAPVAMLTIPIPEPKAEAQELPSSMTSSSQQLPLWVWLVVAMNGCLILGVAYLLYQKLGNKAKKLENPLSTRKGDYTGDLQKACHAHDTKGAERSLLLWAKEHFQELKINNLASIQPLVPDDLREAIEGLQRALYSSGTTWKGETLWKSFKAFKPLKTPKTRGGSEMKLLRELYPE